MMNKLPPLCHKCLKPLHVIKNGCIIVGDVLEQISGNRKVRLQEQWDVDLCCCDDCKYFVFLNSGEGMLSKEILFPNEKEYIFTKKYSTASKCLFEKKFEYVKKDKEVKMEDEEPPDFVFVKNE